MNRKWLAALALAMVLLTPVPLATAQPGFVCPDGSVVASADQCAASGNMVAPAGGGPGGFPGGGGPPIGGGGNHQGGLLGLLHSVTGGLL